MQTHSIRDGRALKSYVHFMSHVIDDADVVLRRGESIPAPGSTSRMIYGPCRVHLYRHPQSCAVYCDVYLFTHKEG